MAEKKEEPTVETGTEPTEPVTTPEPVVPEPTPDPLAGTPYEGKSPAELAKMVGESQDFIKKQASDLGDARNEAAYLKSIQQSQQEPKKPDYEDLDQRFLTNPSQTMDERFNQFGMQSQYQQAQMMAPMVEQQATAVYPIFKSLDDTQKAEVRRYMMATTDPRAGLNPNFALSPDAWNNAAWMIYGRAHPDGPKPASIKPVEPVVTETPQVTKPKEGTSFLSKIKQGYIDIWNEGGFTPEQQEKMAEKMLEGEK